MTVFPPKVFICDLVKYGNLVGVEPQSLLWKQLVILRSRRSKCFWFLERAQIIWHTRHTSKYQTVFRSFFCFVWKNISKKGNHNVITLTTLYLEYCALLFLALPISVTSIYARPYFCFATHCLYCNGWKN